nr:hypothetical protein [Allomuricauda sp.]
MIKKPTYVKLNFDFDAEPNAPSPDISINDSTLILKFLLNPFLWDNVEDDEQAELHFYDVLKYRLGGPGSDNFSDFRYYDEGIDNYGFYHLKNSYWTKDFPLDEKVVSEEPNSENGVFKHYVFFFRDNTFECIAEDFKFVRTGNIIKFDETIMTSIEDTDVLGQPKPSHPRPGKKSKWSFIVLPIIGLGILYAIWSSIFGDNRATFYYPDGRTVESRGDFNQEGVGVGKHTYYYFNGLRRYEMNFDASGKLHGEYLNWNEDGTLIGLTNYTHGVKNGDSKKWDDSDNLIEHIVFHNDSIIQKIK